MIRRPLDDCEHGRDRPMAESLKGGAPVCTIIGTLMPMLIFVKPVGACK